MAEYFQKYTESACLNRSDSKVSNNVDTNTTSNNPFDFKINFILSDKERLPGSMKKSYKNQILTQLSSHLQRISHKVPIEVFAVFLETAAVRTIVNFLEIDVTDEQDFERSVQLIIEKYVIISLKHKNVTL